MRKSDTASVSMSPSVNNLYANVAGRGRVMTGTYRVWRNSATPYLALALKRFTGPVCIHYTLYLGTQFRGDLSNRIKALEDALVEAGVIEGDTYKTVSAFTVRYIRIDEKESHVELKIEPHVIE